MTQNLKAKFSALREFVKTIPAEKLDMRYVFPPVDGCGCVQFHDKNYDVSEPVISALTDKHHAWLFDVDGVRNSTYPIPTGQPAKDEFLRRLDLLEVKYCGGKQ